MSQINTVHRGAHADDWREELDFQLRELRFEPLNQMQLGANRPLGSLGSVFDGGDDLPCRTRHIRQIVHFLRTFRMDQDLDAGNLLAQRAVPILRNDTAGDVFQKLKCAAESMLMDVIPELITGRVTETPLNLKNGSYYSGRKPEDGRIDWSLPAWDIHNLVRAVAPPYPGAFFDRGAHRIEVLGSYFRDESARYTAVGLYFENGSFQADCIDGKRFMITELVIDGSRADLSLFQKLFGARLVINGQDDS